MKSIIAILLLVLTTHQLAFACFPLPAKVEACLGSELTEKFKQLCCTCDCTSDESFESSFKKNPECRKILRSFSRDEIDKMVECVVDMAFF